jgi:hypothetical protein
LCSNGLFRHNIIMDVALPFGNRFLYAWRLNYTVHLQKWDLAVLLEF